MKGITSISGGKMEAGQKILLESGNNEVEMLEFLMGDQSFGVNVAKVQTIIQFDEKKVTHLPGQDKKIIGHYLLKDHSIPLLDLRSILKHPENKNKEIRKIIIVLQFNNTVVSVLVDGINTIHRLSWDQFVPLTEFSTRPGNLATGSFNKNSNDIVIVDFEKIVAELFPEVNIQLVADAHNVSKEEMRDKVNVVHVDDSGTIRNIIGKVLKDANFNNVITLNDGLEAYQYFESLRSSLKAGESLEDRVDIIISDIEMPRMDGLTLCKALRSEFKLKDTPIIMFSSLIDEQMKDKCRSVGATGQITKPEIHNLINLIDELTINKNPKINM